jgi:hypothetical protein
MGGQKKKGGQGSERSLSGGGLSRRPNTPEKYLERTET